ncbi:hypothetical protein RHOW815_000024 [Candidatus Rhabdochlamydia sp. W815]|nr:hypothetical protein RHOW815_000024 [Candidatus Rhabdochlamydia sp. W815]
MYSRNSQKKYTSYFYSYSQKMGCRAFFCVDRKMSQAMEKLRKKTTYKPEYGGSCFYCSTFEKILNRLLDLVGAKKILHA